MLARPFEARGVRIDGGDPTRQLLETEPVLDPGCEVVATLTLAGERRQEVEVDCTGVHALEPLPKLGQSPRSDPRGHRQNPRLHEEKQLAVDDPRGGADGAG